MLDVRSAGVKSHSVTLEAAAVAGSTPGIETMRRRVTAADVRAECVRLGFDLVGLTDVRASDHEAFLRSWLEAGRHGTMAYLSREDAVDRRVRPDAAHPELRTAIVLGINYWNEPARSAVRTTSAARGEERASANDSLATAGPLADAQPTAEDPSRGIIARYARGRDYHKVIKSKLFALLRWLEQEVGRELPRARACVDTSPVLERELAQRAGLGWFGRSTMLLNPKHGSYFFLATLLVEFEFDELDAPFERDHCGTCNACVDACPTGALLGRDDNGAPVIDARRCISYLTIEHRGTIPLELRPLMGNRVFGCDICQEVCPWNAPKFVQLTREPAFAARAPSEPPFGVQIEPGASQSHPGTASPSLIALLETALDESAWDAFSLGSPIRRAGRTGFARNVCVGLGNWASPAAVPVLTRALSDAEPLVRAHAVWALGRVGSAEARAALSSLMSVETDVTVLEDLAAMQA
jgi:epoxyqueuosine reductase